eukprot:171490-Chlamydomonas_euryale.AAC.2
MQTDDICESLALVSKLAAKAYIFSRLPSSQMCICADSERIAKSIASNLPLFCFPAWPAVRTRADGGRISATGGGNDLDGAAQRSAGGRAACKGAGGGPPG